MDALSDYWLVGLLALGVLVVLILLIRSMFGGRREEESEFGPGVSRHTLRAIEERRQAGDEVGVANLLYRTGSYEAAADVYAKVDHPRKAGEAYERAGKAAMAIQAYKRAGLREEAARVGFENGMYLIAAKEYEALGRFVRAAECYLKAEEPQRAAETYGRGEQFMEAAALFERLGMKAQAAEMRIRRFDREFEAASGDLEAIEEACKMAYRAGTHLYEIGRREEAAPVLRRAGYPDEAGRIYAELGALEEAAECFFEAEQFERAALVYERLGEKQAAARCRARAKLLEGDTLGAARDLVETGDFLPAAQLYRGAGESKAAAELYRRAGDPQAAAELYAQESQPERAAALYAEAGEHEQAARLFAVAGRHEEAAAEWATAGNLYESGAALFRSGRPKAALKQLARVAELGAQAEKARALEGRILLQLGLAERAERKFLKAIDGREPSLDTVDYFYKAGRCAEAAGALPDAVRHYEAVVSVDADFGDAQTRLKDLKQQLASQQVASFRDVPRHMVSGSLRSVSRSGTGASAPDWPVMSRYQLISEVARGGMGVVYKARDRVLGRVVAFKVLSENLKSNKTAVEYFLREARSVAAMAHPNIVTIYDAGEEAGEFYMAMEYVEGETLKSVIKRQGALPEKLLRYITIHACRGLSYAHAKGLVHRDIKSGNLMLTRDKVLKIMDFGLAKFVEEAQKEHTKKIGTPYYMSPEQILGKELDNRSDIYSFGITLFECATGKVPFAKGDLSYHHLHTPPPYAKDLNSALSDRMNHLIARCIQKLPEDRFQSADDIVEVLK